MESFIEPTIRTQMSGTSAVENMMKHVSVISVADPSIFLVQGIIERCWQYIVVDAYHAQTSLQQFQIVPILLVCKILLPLFLSFGCIIVYYSRNYSFLLECISWLCI